MRASKKLRSDELLLTGFAATRLRMDLDKIPLWRGDHVAIKQLAEDFARYLYLPRLADSAVLLIAIRDGFSLLTWEKDSFGFADSFDESAGRYRGLRGGQNVLLSGSDAPGLLVKSEIVRKQLDAETVRAPVDGLPDGPKEGGVQTPGTPSPDSPGIPTAPPTQPKRYYGTVALDATRVGRDASRIADEVIVHLAGLVGANVTVTLEVNAEIPSGAPENVVRTVTENSRTLKFSSHGFESE